MVPTNLAGMVAINPVEDDFFCHVIEQKSLHKKTDKPLSQTLKVTGNSGSYGLFVEMNQEKVHKPESVQVFSGEISFERPYTVIEKPGRWYFPPLASLITAGGRLLLTMLERCVRDAGGTYLFCDTDSLCIVSNEHGGLVPCEGGPFKLEGRDAVDAISWKTVNEIADRFNGLNPYKKKLVHEILKVEDVNFVGSDPSKPRRQLFGYAVSAKRYVLYEQDGSDISIVKASGHGLGYLFPPKRGFREDVGAPAFIVEAWEWLLNRELGLPCKEPAWLDLPAMMRIALTSPHVLQGHRPEWLSPFSFFFLPLISELGGYPAGFDPSTFKFITPFTSNRKEWKKLKGINLSDGQTFEMEMSPSGKQDKVVPESFRIVLRHYLRRPESKSLAPDGTPCVADTRGLLQRASIVAGRIIPVGKETDRRWEQGEDISLVDFRVLEYQPSGEMVIAEPTLIDKITNQGLRETMRKTGLSQHTIQRIRAGKPVRGTTLKRMQAAMRA